MSFEAYITFLIKNIYQQKGNVKENHIKQKTTLSSPWFGMLPFLFRWIWQRT